ncbi:MAG: hypothetical protein GX638_12620, partial [Crenarchaeota archaeon]|nr:hypothetical protein [Thermoproteota archaeon]
PNGEYNPLISAFIDEKYEKLFSFNDVKNQLILSSLEDEEKSYITSGYSENGTVSYTQTNYSVTLEVVYEEENFVLTRKVIMNRNSSAVDIIYNISPKNSTLEEFRINISALFETSSKDCNVTQDSVAIFNNIINKETSAEIRIIEHNGNINGTNIIFGDLAGSKPTIKYTLEPSQDDLYVHLRLTTNLPTSDPEEDVLEENDMFNTAYDLLAELDVDYIMVNRYREIEYTRFLYDSEHFSIEYDNNGSVCIFKFLG